MRQPACSLRELEEHQPYGIHLIVATLPAAREVAGWATEREQMEREFDKFWHQFRPSVECEGVDVLGTDEVTLAEIAPYQRFDADWVSFSDDSPATPAAADMTT